MRVGATLSVEGLTFSFPPTFRLPVILPIRVTTKDPLVTTGDRTGAD
jgi:hypothetical protein